MACSEPTEFGECEQTRMLIGGYCSFHRNMLSHGSSFRVDRYYHRKVVKALLEPADVYLSRVELEAMFGGRRPKHDGRPTDLFKVL